MSNPKNQSISETVFNTTVQSLKEMIFHTPLTDETKIQFLKEELSAGRYQIQSQSLASKLIEHIIPSQQSELEEIF